MNAPIDQRDARRIIVGPGFNISFTLKGQAFGEVALANISTGGCYALIEQQEAGLFARGTLLEGLLLLHPDLPKTPITAEVCYVLGCRPGAESELVGIGIHFLSLDNPAQKLLDSWVNVALAAPATSSANPFN